MKHMLLGKDYALFFIKFYRYVTKILHVLVNIFLTIPKINLMTYNAYSLESHVTHCYK